MKTLMVARVCAPMLLCLAGAVQAAGGAAQDESFRVIGRAPTASAWRAAVARDLGANLVIPRPGIGDAPEGVVKVSFRADERGRPGQIDIVQSSNSPALDRAAVFAVSRLTTLRHAPAGVDATRPIEAWVYFANTDATADRFETMLRRESAGVAAPGATNIAAPLMLAAR